MKLKSVSDAHERRSILTTLAIAALIHNDNEAVRKTAQRLRENASFAIQKSLLDGLANSSHALDIIYDTVIQPVDEKVIGTVYWQNYEYELIVKWRDHLEYQPSQIVDKVAALFVQRGHVDGRLYMSFSHPYYRGGYTTSVKLDEFSRYSQVA